MSDVLVELREAVGVITLNRPERLNAVTPDMGGALRDAFLDLEANPHVRAIVLAGAGRAFCSGADIKGETGDAEAVLRESWNPLVTTMCRLEVPILAAVGGVAAGAGASLAFACDLRVASVSARFQLSFVKIGLMPDAGATWLLPRLVGLGRANELALLGRDLSAEEAREWGLVNELVDDGHATQAAMELAARFSGLSASAGAAKLAHHAALEAPLDDHLDREARMQGALQRRPDFAEATAAFRDRREPLFAQRPVRAVP